MPGDDVEQTGQPSADNPSRVHSRRRRGVVAGSVAAVLVAVAGAAWIAFGPADCAVDGCGRESAIAGPPAADPPPPQPSSPVASSAVPSPTRGSQPTPGATASRGGLCGDVDCRFPNATDTGPGKGTFAKATGNISVYQDGAVFDHLDLRGSLDIYADNVTVSHCRITTTNWWGINLRAGHTGLRVLHCVITGVPGSGPDNGGEDYGIANSSNGSVEVGWNDISKVGNALSLGHGNVHDNYVHDLSAFVNASHEYQHTDALISDGGDTGGLVVRHNTLLNPVPVDKGASAALGLFADAGPVSDTTVDGNWLAGGAYAFYGGGAGARNVKVTNNVFSARYWPNCGYYGFAAAWNASGPGNVWSNNVTSGGIAVSP